MDEHRVVTMLFADLVGSTAVAERLHPEEAKLVLGDAIAQLISVAESYGGFIKDIAGDGVLAFFGAPVAHEDDPERAVRAGLQIVATIAEYGRQVHRGWGVSDLSVRVGVHTGEVVVGLVGGGNRLEYGAVGDAVNVAARLQSRAEPGEVLVSAATRRSIAERFTWGKARELELKGKTAPVVAYPARGLAAGERPGEASARPLVGRDAELQVLTEALDGLGVGQGGILVISGEAGIGKSRLAAELRTAGALRGVDWLEGRCVSYGESLPYWPLRDLLGGWLGLSAQDPEVKVRVTLQRRLEEIRPGWSADACPYLGTALGLPLDDADGLARMSPEAIQYRTFEVITELIEALAERRPLVVLLDDIHWADPTSLALTERLLALAEVGAVLVVLTTRPETDHASWQLKEGAAREYRHVYRELALAPLSRDAEASLLRSLSGERQLDPAMAERVLEYSAGNAFYLEEIVRSLDESGRSGEHGDDVQIPDSVEGIIVARIDRLETDWRELLTAASVLGRTFTTDVLCAVTETDEATVRSALHHLLRLDLMQYDRTGTAPAYRFKHGLIQEAAYRTLSTARREAIHARAAEWYETAYADRAASAAGLIAYHWLGGGRLEKAARYLRLAGDHALSRWALGEAIDHYRALLDVLERAGEAGQTAELLFQLGSTLHLAFRVREANAVWEAAFARWTYPQAPSVEPAGRLRIATNQLPWSTDLGLGYYATNQSLLLQLWDGLVEARPAPYVVPGLACSWSVSEDGLRYGFRLRDDATWNDGTPILADQVVRAYQRVVDPTHLSMNAPMALVVENADAVSRGELPARELGVRALDPLTVEIRLVRPFPAFLFYGIYPEFSVFRSDLDTTGPFRLETMDEHNVVVERDPRYRRRRGGNVRTIEWVLASDPGRLADAARRDEVDAIWGHARLTIDPGEAGLEVVETPRTQTGFVAFIGSGRFATDSGLRRALAFAIDRTVLAPGLPSHQTIATGGLVPPGLAGHTPDIAPPFDPDRARRALGTSSHRGPLTVMFAREQKVPYLDLMLDMWREHLALDVRVLEEPMARNADWGMRCHAAYWQWVAHAPDPEYFLWNLLHSKSRSKLGTWSSPRLDSLLEEARRLADGAERLELDHEADRQAVHEESLVIPIVYGGIRWLVKPWVHGIWQWGAPWQSMDEVVVDDMSPRSRG